MGIIDIDEKKIKLPEIGQKNWGDLINKYMVAVASLLSSALRDFVSKNTDATISGIKSFKTSPTHNDDRIVSNHEVITTEANLNDVISTKTDVLLENSRESILSSTQDINNDIEAYSNNVISQMDIGGLFNDYILNNDKFADNSITQEKFADNTLNNISLNENFFVPTTRVMTLQSSVSNNFPTPTIKDFDMFIVPKTIIPDSKRTSVLGRLYITVEGSSHIVDKEIRFHLASDSDNYVQVQHNNVFNGTIHSLVTTTQLNNQPLSSRYVIRLNANESYPIIDSVKVMMILYIDRTFY